MDEPTFVPALLGPMRKKPSMKKAAKKASKVVVTSSAFDSYSEQDSADKLILPYLTLTHGFPRADSLDYQAQHTLETSEGKSGRYDGLYLSGGYPYAVLEAKRHAHDLTEEDFKQARSYATELLPKCWTGLAVV